MIFSAAKSMKYSGYALMTSEISNTYGRYWIKGENIMLGGQFQVNWITTWAIDYTKWGNIQNSYNNDELIKKSRDATELPPEIGKAICLSFETPVLKKKEIPEKPKAPSNQNLSIPPPMPPNKPRSPKAINNEEDNEMINE